VENLKFLPLKYNKEIENIEYVNLLLPNEDPEARNTCEVFHAGL